jgi:uncharacterized protein YndB with AHSA1/START domain
VGSMLRGSVLLPVGIERAWDLWVDAARYTQWQTMLFAVREISGPVSTPGTTYVLDHGPKMQRRVRVLVAERPVRHVIEQSGMGVQDELTATFEPEGDGTRLTLFVVYRLGRLMTLLARLDRKSRSERELQRELDRLAVIAARVPPTARVGGLYLAEAGTVRRRLTVLAVDRDRVHVRLHPGHLREREPEDSVPIAPKPPSDQLDLRPIDPPIRANLDAPLMGLPFLRRDGGHGVRHLALSLDAWADTLAREVGDDAVTDSDAESVAAWRERGAPTVGVDADLDLAPTCTLRLDTTESSADSWAVAKLLRSELMRVHLRIAADRWPERPLSVPPSAWLAAPVSFEEATGDMSKIWPVMIGHYPLSRAGLGAAKPQFAGVATLEHEELGGYRTWREHHGGTFDSLDWALRPADTVPPVDLLTPSSGVSFGDRARVVETPLTLGLGVAGAIGTVVGHTTPSLAYATDIVGESALDVAVGLSLEDRASDSVVWIAAELVEFVDHAGADEITIAGRRLKRASDGEWRNDDS